VRDPRTPASHPARRRALLLAALVAVVAACGEAPQTVLEPASRFAQQPDDLFRIVLVIALGVFFVVQGLIVYAVIKFRDKGDETPEPEQIHGNTRLELVWTLIPALILAGIAVPTVQAVFDLAEEDPDALIVNVIGHRWWWEYEYETDAGTFVTANELVIPEDQPITLKMTSQEQGGPANAVLHSYWVPALAGKQDVAPGRITTLNMQADDPGVYMGQCTEYCGLSHANMRNYATVLTQADYDAWVDEQLAPAPVPAAGSLEATGAELFQQTYRNEDTGEQQACIQCHMISGEGAIVGPNLTHLMSREMFAGAIHDLYERPEGSTWGDWTDVPNTELLATWVENAPSLKAMRPNAETGKVGMPNLDIPAEDLDAIVAYLLTLE
jgi:cytochrome c oxidase subunit 2